MKRKLLSQLFALPILLGWQGCHLVNGTAEEDSLAVAGQRLTYQQTQCADPWQPCAAQEVTACAAGYLQQQGFTVLEISTTKENEGAVCLACNCPSGRVLQVKVSEQDVSRLLALGFKKK